MNSREATIALNMLPKIGPVRVQRLLAAFGSPEAILTAPISNLIRVQGIGNELAATIHGWENTIDLTRELDEAKARNLTIITQEDAVYPDPLREIYDPPLAFYVWGELKESDKHAIAIVGSRKTSNYGRETAHQLSHHLAASGQTIVSGMARGIDTFAHQGAVAANGRTVAVIGSGLGQIYPPENMPLAEKIADGFGAVISEFPIHMPPSKKTFPMRNRIVAGWSHSTIVVECPKWSGSIITANLAIDMGKNLYAVPGPINRPTSAGCNQLIRDGATLITSAHDVIEDLSSLPLGLFTPETPQKQKKSNSSPPDNTTPAPPTLQLSDTESTILEHLTVEELTLDQLSQLTSLSIPALMTNLLTLEVKRLIRQLPGARYTIRQPEII